KIELSSKPVIAAVNGFALGGGCELALACHVRIASTQAKFGLPEVKLGLIPGYGGTQRLPRLIGRGPALQLILTGDPIDGTEAARLGLANAVVEPGALIAAARAMAATMLKNAPVAMARAIEAVDVGLDATLEDGLRLEARLFGSLESTADMREGTKAFLEKRPAAFRGQ
ncbi:MAG TPA: enoyl-CoA hydratase-related protein, partial [Gemmatimonadaceae bacterium]|nr:enoyl-CoA hydratase-related protein [Gemmatimonadaceae bacterium]